jgi:hypothetical protein
MTPVVKSIQSRHAAKRDGRNRKAWRRFSKQILAAANGQCQLRLPGCTTTAHHAHRIGGGYHDLDVNHYRAACRACHARLHGQGGVA